MSGGAHSSLHAAPVRCCSSALLQSASQQKHLLFTSDKVARLVQLVAETIANLCCAVSCCAGCRTGVYGGHSASISQLLVLGDQLLSLGKDGQLLVWRIGEYDSPQVRQCVTFKSVVVVRLNRV